MSKIFTRRTFLHQAGRVSLAGLTGTLVGSSLQGCLPSSLSSMSSTLSNVSGYAESAQKSAAAIQKATKSPEQEYYIGRTVGAVVLSKYKAYNNKAATHYLNVVGQTLAQASDLPETFNGYHLLILDSEEINAFATPSGLIFVTRGMLRCCRNEGELAAILGPRGRSCPVQARHAVHRKGEGDRGADRHRTRSHPKRLPSDIASLTRTFEGSISDITTTMISNGYSGPLRPRRTRRQ